MNSKIDIYFVPCDPSSMNYEYRQIESALVACLRVPAAEMGAFRAKIRHLRNLGLPKLEKVGSGTRAKYSRKDAIEMALALELMQHGIKPSYAVQLVGSLLGGTRSAFKPKPEADQDDSYIYLADGNVIIIEGMNNIASAAARSPAMSFSVVNVSRLVRRIDDGLKS